MSAQFFDEGGSSTGRKTPVNSMSQNTPPLRPLRRLMSPPFVPGDSAEKSWTCQNPAAALSVLTSRAALQLGQAELDLRDALTSFERNPVVPVDFLSTAIT